RAAQVSHRRTELSIHAERAAPGADQPGQDAKQRALPRPARADERDPLSAPELHRDVVQGGLPGAGARMDETHALDADLAPAFGHRRGVERARGTGEDRLD